jgi:hypothetical protein
LENEPTMGLLGSTGADSVAGFLASAAQNTMNKVNATTVRMRHISLWMVEQD